MLTVLSAFPSGPFTEKSFSSSLTQRCLVTTSGNITGILIALGDLYSSAAVQVSLTGKYFPHTTFELQLSPRSSKSMLSGVDFAEDPMAYAKLPRPLTVCQGEDVVLEVSNIHNYQLGFAANQGEQVEVLLVGTPCNPEDGTKPGSASVQLPSKNILQLRQGQLTLLALLLICYWTYKNGAGE